MQINFRIFFLKHKYIFLIILISLIPLLWFINRRPFARGDAGLEFIFNFKFQLKEIFQYTWNDFVQTGVYSGSNMTILSLFLFNAVLELLRISPWLNQAYKMILILFISILFFYLFLKDLFYKYDLSSKIALFSAVFYIFNPLTYFLYLRGLILNIYVLPFSATLFFFVNRYLKTQNILHILIFLPLSYLFFSSVFSNPAFVIPVMILLVIYSIFIIKTNYYDKSKVRLFGFLVKFTAITILSNLYWFLPFIFFARDYFNSAAQVMNPLDVVLYTSYNYARLSAFLRLLPFGYDYYLWVYNQSYWFSWFFKSPIFISIGTLIFLYILFFSFMLQKVNSKIRLISTFFLSFFLLSLFLMKGIREPLGGVYVFLFTHIPYFKAFRSPYNKFSIIYIISVSILFGIASKYFIEWARIKFIKPVYYFLYLTFFFLIVLYNFPLIAGFIFTDPVRIRGNIITSDVEVPNYYSFASNWLNTDKVINRILALPLRPLTYVGFKWNYGYDSNEVTPILLKHKTIAMLGYSRDNSMKILGYASDKNISDIVNLIPYYNIKYLINQKDVDPVYGNYGKVLKNSINIDKELKKSETIKYIKSIGELDIFKVSQANFFLNFYTPNTIVITIQNIENLSQIVSQPDYKIRSAIYFSQQITDNSKQKVLEKVPKEINYTPVLEFKKINPTKYKIVVHGAKDTFPLVFSESYHDGWKGYVVSSNLKSQNSNLNLKSQNLNNYKILDGNEEDQASKEELASFIEKGWVSGLGDGREKKIEHKKYENGKEKLDYIEKYKIDFVSKNFQDTIQNDNLPTGKFYETWFARKLTGSWVTGLTSLNKNVLEIPEKNHLMVNGYANSWIIDPKMLCEELAGSKVNGLCKKNPDGSYDLELVVEFWPQRLFYIGLGISGMTLLFCVGYLIYDWRRKKDFRYI